MIAVAVVVVLVVGVVAIVAFAGGSSPEALSEKGVNVYVTDDCSLGAKDWQAVAQNQVNGITSLGANSIALAYPFYTESITADRVLMSDRCASNPGGAAPLQNTVSPERLAVLVRAAHAAGLKVVLRPLLDETNLTKWRGVLAPANEQAWFASYGKALEPYLRMAKAERVEQFSVSGELNSLAGSKYWPALIKSAHDLYGGKLVFATTWPVGGTTAHPDGSVIGIDAYPRLPNAKDTASATEVLAGWNAALRTQALPKGAVLYEVGINANNGAYALPSQVALGAFNEQVQANWFTAACRFAKAQKLAGIYFWGPDLRFNSGNLTSQPVPTSPFQLQPSAQTAIRECF
jgi:hypothetical protein